MKKMLMAVMILIAVMFMGNVIDANASNSKALADAGDYKENSPC